MAYLEARKATDAQLPRAAIERAGYHAVFRERRDGTASPSCPARRVSRADPNRPARRPSRRGAHIYPGAVQDVLIGSLYLPHGNPWPGPKFDYKIEWTRH